MLPGSAYRGFLNEMGGRVVVPLASFMLGGLAEWLRARVRRWRDRKAIEIGHRFNTIEFVQVMFDEHEGNRRLHVQSLGSLPLSVFMPSESARAHLLQLATASEKDLYKSLIPMVGALGSFVLRELHGLLRMLTPKSGFPLQRWLRVPILENYYAFEFTTPTVLLVRVEDLHLFQSFADCRDIQVLHGSDGGKILTLLEVATAFEKQKELMQRARSEGRSTRHLEETWVMYLRLDTELVAPTSEAVLSGEEKGFRPVPWERYCKELEILSLQS